MRKTLLILFLSIIALQMNAAISGGNQPNPKPQIIDAQDSIVFDCSQLTGVTGAIQIPVSIISDDTIYSVDFSLKYDHNSLQYDTTVDVTTYLQALSFYNTNDSTIRFTSSTFTPVKHDTTIALVKFILLSPAFATSDLYTFKGYLNGSVCSIKFIPPSPVGLNNSNELMKVNVYPNPSAIEANITFTNADRVEVFNLVGQNMLSENVKGMNAFKFSTEDLINGIYLIKLTSDYGTAVKKITVSH